MKKQQSGFTLIELIAVIVILGILSAVAVPRFVNLQDAARQSAAEGTAGALASGSALNYAEALAVDAGVSTATPVDTSGGCASASNLVNSSLANYTIQAGTFPAGPPAPGLGDSITCTIEDNADNAVTADFPLYYVD